VIKVRFTVEVIIFLFVTASKGLAYLLLPSECLVLFPRGKGGQSVMLTTHVHLVLRLTISVVYLHTFTWSHA
jgi:hypothetical protein